MFHSKMYCRCWPVSGVWGQRGYFSTSFQSSASRSRAWTPEWSWRTSQQPMTVPVRPIPHAVDVYPMVGGDGLVDVIEDGRHILWFFRNASVVDGKSGRADVDAHVASFQLRGIPVGNQLSVVGQVDEVVDSSVSRSLNFADASP